MKVRFRVCSANFVRRRKKTHGHIILLGSIKWHNNFVLKISLTACWTQIKAQILPKKKKNYFKPTCLCIIRYVCFYNVIQYALLYL